MKRPYTRFLWYVIALTNVTINMITREEKRGEARRARTSEETGEASEEKRGEARRSEERRREARQARRSEEKRGEARRSEFVKNRGMHISESETST